MNDAFNLHLILSDYIHMIIYSKKVGSMMYDMKRNLLPIIILYHMCGFIIFETKTN